MNSGCLSRLDTLGFIFLIVAVVAFTGDHHRLKDYGHISVFRYELTFFPGAETLPTKERRWRFSCA